MATKQNSGSHDLEPWKIPVERLEIQLRMVVQPDKAAVMEAVAINGWALANASAKFKDDRDVVLTAVAQTPMVLCCASERCRSDKAIVMTAVRENGLVLRYAAAALRKDKDVVIAAVSESRAAITAADLSLQLDPDVQIASVGIGIHQPKCKKLCLRPAPGHRNSSGKPQQQREDTDRKEGTKRKLSAQTYVATSRSQATTAQAATQATTVAPQAMAPHTKAAKVPKPPQEPALAHLQSPPRAPAQEQSSTQAQTQLQQENIGAPAPAPELASITAASSTHKRLDVVVPDAWIPGMNEGMGSLKGSLK